MKRLLSLAGLLVLIAAPAGLGQINTTLRQSDLLVRYNDLAPNLLSSETGTAGAATIRGGDGGSGLAAWGGWRATATAGLGSQNAGY